METLAVLKLLRPRILKRNNNLYCLLLSQYFGGKMPIITFWLELVGYYFCTRGGGEGKRYLREPFTEYHIRNLTAYLVKGHFKQSHIKFKKKVGRSCTVIVMSNLTAVAGLTTNFNACNAGHVHAYVRKWKTGEYSRGCVGRIKGP